MNGENFQLCSIVTSVKHALNGSNLQYTPLPYVKQIHFRFSELHQSQEVSNVVAWYQRCLDFGLNDIKCMMPVSTDDRSILGFANTNRGSILCFFSDVVTYFVATWTFEDNQWNVEYQEYVLENPPLGKPHFDDNTDSLLDILHRISNLACRIKEDHWKLVFDDSIQILQGQSIASNMSRNPIVLDLPEKNLRLLRAAFNADVFGAMGSWNDFPPYSAHEVGLDDEYNSNSSELLKQIRNAALYAVNEW